MDVNDTCPPPLMIPRPFQRRPDRAQESPSNGSAGGAYADGGCPALPGRTHSVVRCSARKKTRHDCVSPRCLVRRRDWPGLCDRTPDPR